MNKAVKNFIGFWLLLSIASSLVPVNFFHDHEEHQHAHCDQTNTSLESDPCHVSIYHAYSQEHTCEHNSHATESEEDCELCQYITSQRVVYTINSFEELTSLKFSIEYPLTHAPAWVWNSSLSIRGRAPPVA